MTNPSTSYFRGIQLLPNNPLPYVQTTLTSEETELEDWDAYIVELCSEIETDITDYFMVERSFQDTNGVAQIDWSLTDIPYDFGNKLVYLKVDQAFGETFYSNVFMLTSYNSDRTCRIDYKSRLSDTMQSIQVRMYFWQTQKKTEISSYYEVSTRNTVTSLVKSQKFERWITEVIPNDLMIKIDDAFENKYVYIDLVRANLFEANEIKEFQGTENWVQNILKIAFNTSDVYDPLYVAPVVSATPSITLNSVVTSGLNAIYDFTLTNFSPMYLTYQYSDDQVTWTNVNGSITNNQSIPFEETGTWYFRISHPEAISNIIELDLGSAISAVDDNTYVLTGGLVDVSVLLNDTLVGTTTITLVSTPTNGTATIIDSGTKVRYEHDGGVSTSDSFTYTISNGTTTDTATVNISIVEVTDFLMFDYGGTKYQQACVVGGTALLRYHNGIGDYPSIGDKVLNSLLPTDVYIGYNKYYRMGNNKAIKIDYTGTVLDIKIC